MIHKLDKWTPEENYWFCKKVHLNTVVLVLFVGAVNFMESISIFFCAQFVILMQLLQEISQIEIKISI